MATPLAQCDAFGFIYDQAGDPAADILVVLKRVLDASGNPILLSPKTTVTDSAGSFHFTLPELATAFISARASALWNCPDGRPFTVPVGPSGELIPGFSLSPSSLVEPPLVYVGDVLSIPKASASQDGYLSAADFVAFEAGAAMGVNEIDTGTGLIGGPITDAGTIALATIPGVAGTWPNPTSITVNAQGQIISITSGAPDTIPPVISAIATASLVATSVTITWTTNEPADSQVEYGPTTSYGTSTTLDTSPVTSHSVPLTGLSASSLYHYRVKSRDTASNLATSADNTFTTTAVGDTTAPVISAVASSGLTATGATITWTTDDAADSQVEYSTDTSFSSSTSITNTSPLVTSHSVPLTGLVGGTLYHYRVKSRNAASLLTTSPGSTFTTTVPDTTPPAISAVTATSITDIGATITWTTDEASNSQVDYGTSTSYGSSTTIDATMLTSHSVPLTGLAANTLYHYRVKSRDAASNLATSTADTTFTTAAGPLALTDNLVSYWKFDEASGTRMDSITASGNNLAVNNTIGSQPGVVGSAAISNVGGDGGGWLSCLDNPTLNFTGKPLTVAGWMKMHSTAATYTTLVGKWFTGDQEFALWYRSDTVNFEFAVSSDGSATTTVSVDIPGPAALNQWYFLCAIYDRPNAQIKISVDNGAFAVVTFPGPSIFHGAQDLACLAGAATISFATIDELGIWERVLPSTDITRLAGGITYPFP